jgi:hypothetical protein
MGGTQADFPTTKALLESFGISISGRSVGSREEAVAAATQTGFPCVLGMNQDPGGIPNSSQPRALFRQVETHEDIVVGFPFEQEGMFRVGFRRRRKRGESDERRLGPGRFRNERRIRVRTAERKSRPAWYPFFEASENLCAVIEPELVQTHFPAELVRNPPAGFGFADDGDGFIPGLDAAFGIDETTRPFSVGGHRKDNVGSAKRFVPEQALADEDFRPNIAEVEGAASHIKRLDPA